MNPILSTHTWVSLSQEMRNRLRALFNIPRSSHVSVLDGKVESDGTTSEDLRSITTEKMQVYLKDESSDFHKLLDKVLSRLQDEIDGKPEVKEEIIIAKPKTNGKKK